MCSFYKPIISLPETKKLCKLMTRFRNMLTTLNMFPHIYGLVAGLWILLLGFWTCCWVRSLAVGVLHRISYKGAFGPFNS